MLTKKTQMSQKVPKTYYCETCDYITCDKKDYNKHCATRKQLELTKLTESNKELNTYHICSYCDKKYKSIMGLWRHSKICKPPKKKIFL